ncbi:unnamed protein product [Ambrosiozyma monospora]|uniref:Unnamed protein product n=1 Tax=Ambrosiozyma monospora TaxID=43982 RepID=A0ACB5T4F6_AMBMO|nr:unnamed protein product [Ambrosiozyma monospora]
MADFKEPRRMIRAFDAFPKVPPSQQVHSVRGGYTSLMMYLFMIFLIWIEIGGYIDGEIHKLFTVDDVIRHDLRINVDLIVAMPCNFLNTNVRDATDDRFLASELLNFQGTTAYIPTWFFESKKKVVTPEMESVLRNSMNAEFQTQGTRDNEELPACHIYGYIPVNRVKGDFHITAKGYGYRDRSFVPMEQLNFTHYINEFSFGDFYPYMDNQLDMTYKITDESHHSFHYHMTVVPTTYKKLGVEIDTNQYSLTNFETGGKYIPGIFFRYDFDPIKMIIEENRIPFWQFVIRLVTIIGGLVVIAKWTFKGFEKLIYISFGKEFARRGDEKKEGGLLDRHEEEFETI